MIHKLRKWFRPIWKEKHDSAPTDKTITFVTVSVYYVFLSKSGNFELYFFTSAFYFTVLPLYKKCERKKIIRSCSALIKRHLHGLLLRAQGLSPVVPVHLELQERRLEATKLKRAKFQSGISAAAWNALFFKQYRNFKNLAR